MRVSVTTRYAACLVLAGLVVLPGCTTKSPEATTSTPASSTSTSASSDTPMSSSSSTTTTTPSVTPTADPNIPAAARVNTPEGAQAFTIYLGTILNRAFVNQDEHMLDTLMLPSCKSCKGIVDSIVAYRDKKHHFVGEYLHFTSATWSDSMNGSTKIVADSDQSGGKLLDEHGGLVERAAPSKGKVSVQLVFDAQWRVSELQVLA